MLNDPRIWGDPEAFRPERHFASDASRLPNPSILVFGFGMRACPGMYLADRIGFDFATKTLSVYNILPLEGKKRPEPSSIEYSPSIIRTPQNLECRFVPRSEKARRLLASVALAIDN
ncbi:cytochrome P450 [Serendipita vermifera]|nr:cytochrome P450 [Serendipita vermifera]